MKKIFCILYSLLYTQISKNLSPPQAPPKFQGGISLKKPSIFKCFYKGKTGITTLTNIIFRLRRTYFRNLSSFAIFLLQITIQLKNTKTYFRLLHGIHNRVLKNCCSSMIYVINIYICKIIVFLMILDSFFWNK